ncbi:facilitated trehalose transporter Tret1-like [Nasonia vitripennis]|uniref:Major facilitator superfamily (MFS) profile domain-containing protein n=1 Tax=Nasonia vitripennis TaxID=7425 RepID=A0A7M7Q6M9_NASVI|nr:facilitated trehalose transporter Tret1-like [Nasonia vitripennis]
MYRRQWLTTINFILVVMLIGMAHGHSAILLQQFQNTTMNATKNLSFEDGEMFKRPFIIVNSIDLQSWIASSMVLFMCPGCWILAVFSKNIGRKLILLFAVFLFLISWLIITLAHNAYHVIIGRSLSGLCMGILAGLTSVYQGEISIPKLRSTLNAVLAVSFSIGIELCHAVGTWFHWRTTAFFCCCITILTLFMNCRMPESPIWLLNKNKFPEAIHSWVFLRGIRDLDELKSMRVTKSNKRLENVYSEKNEKKYFSTGFLKPLGILLGLFTVTQMSGMGAVTFYCIQMVTDISGPDYAYIPTLILDTFRLIAAIILTIISSRSSTRTLTLCSSFSCSIFLICLSMSILFKLWNPWLALTFLFAFEAAVVMGLGPLPWTFCSEIFSVPHKEVGIGIVTSYNYLFFFMIVKMNPYFFVVLKPWGSFLVYGCFTLISSIGLYFILPDTQNKSLKEIEMMFRSD